MKVREEYKTYGKSRSVRLKGFDYGLPYAYSVTILCKNRQKFFENRQLSESVIECLRALGEKMTVKILAYCIMPDHLHLILSPRGKYSVPEIVKFFKANSTKTSWKLGLIGSLWQRSYHDHILRKNENIIEAVNYVLNNPMRAGLVKDYEDYKFCGTMDEIEM